MVAGGPRRATGETDPPRHEVPNMRRSIRLLVATLLALAAAAPAAAHVGDQPCETGAEFAHEHVAHMAMAGELGLNHAPGEHQGYSTRPAVCD